MTKTFTVSVTHCHFVDLPNNSGGIGPLWITDPPTDEVVEVEVDLAAIAFHYGPCACRAEHKECRQLNGAVVVRKI